MREAFPSLPFDTIDEHKEKDTIISKDGSEVGITTSKQQIIIIGYNTTTSTSSSSTTSAAVAAPTRTSEYGYSNVTITNTTTASTTTTTNATNKTSTSNGKAGGTVIQHQQSQTSEGSSAPNSGDEKNSSTVSALLSHLPFPGELEELRNILHFPEEVALRLTDSEYQLFYQVKKKTIIIIIHFHLTFYNTNVPLEKKTHLFS